MSDILVLLESARGFTWAISCAVTAVFAGLILFDRAPRKDAWFEDASRPPQRRVA